MESEGSRELIFPPLTEPGDAPLPNLTPRHQELIPTPCGPIKPWSELSCPVKVYFCITLVSLLSIIGLTIKTLAQKSDENFTVSLIQLIGVVFCIYYVTRGILQENRQELIVFILSILLVMLRSLVNFLVLMAEEKPAREDPVILARFLVVLSVGCFDVVCAVILIRSQGMMAFRVGGALESLQAQYFMLNLCFSMLTFDLQAQNLACSPSSDLLAVSLAALVSDSFCKHLLTAYSVSSTGGLVHMGTESLSGQREPMRSPGEAKKALSVCPDPDVRPVRLAPAQSHACPRRALGWPQSDHRHPGRSQKQPSLGACELCVPRVVQSVAESACCPWHELSKGLTRSWILRELKVLVWIFLVQNVPEVAYLFYLLYTISRAWGQGSSYTAEAAAIVGSCISVAIKSVLLWALVHVYRSFGQGLRERMFSSYGRIES
ncbi:uncharacterized protein [Petaurus breviceps papuanus]|uniref:uncharacterized protein isoform X2 n=1 Tax=Petaurus breviceps papuanus TaxID=3040969 RepID=UPI0036DF2E59